MTVSAKSLGIDRLPIDDRLNLIEEIWDSITADAPDLPLTKPQRAELERRLADDIDNPDDTVTWEQVRADIRSRLTQ